MVATNGTDPWLRTVPVVPVKRSPEARGWLLASNEGVTKGKGFSSFSGIPEANFSVGYHLILVDIRPATVGSTGEARLPVFGSRCLRPAPRRGSSKQEACANGEGLSFLLISKCERSEWPTPAAL